MISSARNPALGPFDPIGDLPMVAEWLRRPHVARWWGDPKEATAAIRKHPVQASAVIFADNTPIGFLCWQVPTPEELAAAGLTDLPANLVDVDIFIGESWALGQGLGSEALSQQLAKFRDAGVRDVGIATADSNPQARKAFEKVGFRVFRAFTESGEGMRYLTRAL